MKTLYIDCSMGAAGDMLTAALLELMPDPDAALAELNALGIPGVEYRRERSVKCGVAGTHVTVLANGEEEGAPPHDTEETCGTLEAHDAEQDHDAEETHGGRHVHADLQSVGAVIGKLPLSDKVWRDVMTVYESIAEAESAVHGVPVTQIHFHEVGTLDAIADITAVCYLMARLAPEEVIVSPVHVGSGHVRCTHGELPVPTPAAAYILRGVPIYSGDILGELCTPTGAALIKHFVTRFGAMPVMRISEIGYGMGKKDFPQANCVRVLLGERDGVRDTVSVLSCTLEDMTAEELGFAAERLFACGALEVYTVPVGMRKNRPGTLLRVVCSTGEKEKMAGSIFRYTSAADIREAETGRFVLEQTTATHHTAFGDVRVERAEGYGVARSRYAFDDLARIAQEREVGIPEARALLDRD